MNLFLVTARVLLGTVLLTGLCFLTSSFASQPTIRIGLEEDIESLPFVKETVASLENSLADYPMVFVPIKSASLQQKAELKDLDFVILSPEKAALVYQLGQAYSIASEQSELSEDPARSLSLTILVPTERNKDAGQIGFLNKPSEFQCLLANEIMNHSPNAGKQSSCMQFNGMDHLLSALKNGEIEAAALKPCALEASNDRLNEIKVLNEKFSPKNHCSVSSEGYPNLQFMAVNGAPAELRDLLTGTLKTLYSGKGGATWSDPVSLLPVKHLLEKYKVKEYIEAQPLDWARFIERFYYPLAAVVLLFLFFVIHSFLVELKVRKQTRKLLKSQLAKEAAERKAREKQAEMEKLERVNIVGQMSSMIAHELKQPLSSITNYLNALTVLINKEATDKELLRYSVIKMKESNQKAAAIIDHVRSYAKSTKTERHELNLSSLALKIFRDFEVRTRIDQQMSNIAFKATVQEDILIDADELEVSLAIYNILKNAVEAVKSVDDAFVSLEISRDGDDCCLIVKDNGAPLTEEQKINLESPFRTSKTDGLGLGLAIVKRIMESHAGKILFECNPAGGLKACLIFPLAQGDK